MMIVKNVDLVSKLVMNFNVSMKPHVVVAQKLCLFYILYVKLLDVVEIYNLR